MKSLVVMCLCALTTVVRAAEVAVFVPRATNISQEDSDVIGALIAQNYAEQSGRTVMAPNESRATLASATDERAAAQLLGVAEYLEVGVVRLGEKIKVRATLYNTASGDELYSAHALAMSLDDMEFVAERIARALYGRKPLRETRTLGSVTAAEGRAPNRTFVEKVMGFKLNTTQPIASGKDFDTHMSLLFDGRLESERYFLEFGAGLVLPTGSRESDVQYGGLIAEMGASYYLANANVSPYVGAGLAPSILAGDDVGGLRLAAYGQAGVMALRESSSRVYSELRVGQFLLPFEGENGRRYYPTELTLGLGIGW